MVRTGSFNLTLRGIEMKLYYNGAVNSDWATLGNWWTDAACTVAASALPTTELTYVLTTTTLAEIPVGKTCHSNAGTVTLNSGTLRTNEPGGVMVTNSGLIQRQLGELTTNSVTVGVVTMNAGTTTTNNGLVTANNTGTIGTNSSTGTVSVNFGIVLSNAGTVTAVPNKKYWNGAVDTDWAVLGNWWDDAACTVQSTVLPANGDAVYIVNADNMFSAGTMPATISLFSVTCLTTNTNGLSALGVLSIMEGGTLNVESGPWGLSTGTIGLFSASGTAHIGMTGEYAGLAVVGEHFMFTGTSGSYGTGNYAEYHDSSVLDGGPLVEYCEFFDSSYMATGNNPPSVSECIFHSSSYMLNGSATLATFNDDAFAAGTITNATFNGNSTMVGATITTAVFNGTSKLVNGSVTTATLNDDSRMDDGYVGTATFNGTCHMWAGSIDTATFQGSGGSVGGTITDGLFKSSGVLNGGTVTTAIFREYGYIYGGSASTAKFYDSSDMRGGTVDTAEFIGIGGMQGGTVTTATFTGCVANIGTITTATFYTGSSCNGANMTTGYFFNDSYANYSNITDAYFYDTSSAASAGISNATFYDSSVFSGGVIGTSASFYGNSYSAGASACPMYLYDCGIDLGGYGTYVFGFNRTAIPYPAAADVRLGSTFGYSWSGNQTGIQTGTLKTDAFSGNILA